MAFSRTYFLTTSLKIGTPKFRRIALSLLPWKNLHEMRDIVDVLTNTSVEIFEEKKKALEREDITVTQQVEEGNDIMGILSAYHLFPYMNIVEALLVCSESQYECIWRSQAVKGRITRPNVVGVIIFHDLTQCLIDFFLSEYLIEIVP